MPKSLGYSLLFGILLVAAFLRFFHLTTTPPGLYCDEAMDGNNAVEAAETNHFQVFYIEDGGREGLYVDIVAAIIKVWPVYEPWIIRLPAAIAGVLTVGGIYLLVAELFGDGQGLLAAFLLATSFWHIVFSRIGFRAVLAPLLLTWALYLLIKAFRSQKTSISLIDAAFAGIIYALGFYTYIAYRVTPLLFLLFIPFFRLKPGFWKKTALFIIVTCIVAAPLGRYFVQHPSDFWGRIAMVSVINTQNPLHDFAVNVATETLMFNYRGDNNWRHNVSRAPELFWPVGILFVLGIIVAIWSLRKSWRDRKAAAAIADVTNAPDMFPPFALLLTFAWIILGLLPGAASDDSVPHALRSILALPPAMILASLGGVWLYGIAKEHWRWPGALTKSIAIVFLAIVGVFGYVEYFVAWAKNPNVSASFTADYLVLGDRINALPANTPKYIVVDPGDASVHGINVAAQTVMFITHSFTATDAAVVNIHYLQTNETNSIPAETPSVDIFYIENIEPY
jgi:4-amino-4-deoxy-L-arabinose transferase-like glycosyltransferase